MSVELRWKVNEDYTMELQYRVLNFDARPETPQEALVKMATGELSKWGEWKCVPAVEDV